jgi:hypothetical protein
MVSGAVVDQLESVDIDHQRAEGPAKATELGQASVELHVEVAPVGQHGQIVDHGQVRELLDDLILSSVVGGAAKNLDRPNQSVLSIAERDGPDFDRNTMALFVLQKGVGLDGNAGVHRALKWAAVRAQHATAGIDMAQPSVTAVFAHHLATRKPGDPFGAAIPQ